MIDYGKGLSYTLCMVKNETSNGGEKMKYTIHTKAINGGPFNCLPARPFEIDADSILANDVVLPWDTHCHNMRLWVIGNEYGVMGCVWGSNEQDALDTLIDDGLGADILIDEKDADEETTRLGNASKPCNTDYLWMQEASFDLARDCRVLCAFAEARGACIKNLDKI